MRVWWTEPFILTGASGNVMEEVALEDVGPADGGGEEGHTVLGATSVTKREWLQCG